MKKHLKTLLCVFAIYSSLNNTSFAAISGGTSKVAAGESPYKNFSENSVGFGLSYGSRFNLVEDVFTDSEDKNFKAKDHIFTEIEAFTNQFSSGEIKYNLGGRLNLGYEIKGIRIYGSSGYVASNLDYQETGNSKQSIVASAPFFGVGLGYDITKNIGIRLNSMFYSFDFTPKKSEYKSVKVDVSAINIGVALHF